MIANLLQANAEYKIQHSRAVLARIKTSSLFHKLSNFPNKISDSRPLPHEAERENTFIIENLKSRHSTVDRRS
jgi:hypothetical protein